MTVQFIEFLNSYTGSVIYEEIPWGKEGEIDFCITFIGPSTEKEHEFIVESRKLLAASDRVNIHEDHACWYKNWVLGASQF